MSLLVGNNLDLISRYQSDFNQIINLVWHVYNYQPFIEPTPPQLKILMKELEKIRDKYRSTFSLDKSDISQQLLYLWIKYTNQFLNKPKRRTSLRNYLLNCTIWGIKTWFLQEVVAISSYYIPQQDYSLYDLKLNFQFVSDFYQPFPFDELSSYERYLLFLNFGMEKSIIEISNITKKHRHVISKQIHDILDKLRRLTDDYTYSE